MPTEIVIVKLRSNKVLLREEFQFEMHVEKFFNYEVNGKDYKVLSKTVKFREDKISIILYV